jgi:hypothetical protein
MHSVVQDGQHSQRLYNKVLQLTVRPVTALAILVETMVRPPAAQGLEAVVALETSQGRASPARS